MGSVILPDEWAFGQQATSGGHTVPGGPAAQRPLTQSDRSVAHRGASGLGSNRQAEYQSVHEAIVIPGVILVAIGTVSVHVAVPLMIVVAISRIIIKFLANYQSISRARSIAKIRRKAIKRKITIEEAVRLIRADNPDPAARGAGGQAAQFARSVSHSAADPPSMQPWTAFGELEDYELEPLPPHGSAKLMKLIHSRRALFFHKEGSEKVSRHRT